MYGVVKFAEDSDGTTAVVVTKWFTPEKSQVRWPPTKDSKKLERLLKLGAAPDANWKPYEIEKVYYETDDLERAKQKQKALEVNSDIQTESEVEERKRRIIRNPKYYGTSDEEDDNRGPPPLKNIFTKCSEILNIQETAQRAHVQEPEVCAGPSKETELSGVHAEEPNPIVDLGDVRSVPTVNDKTELHPIPKSSKQTVDSELSGIADTILKLLLEIKHQNKTIIEIVNREPSDGCVLDEGFILPVETEEQLDNLEIILKNKQKFGNLVNHIKNIGGIAISSKVSRAMKTILKDSVAVNYNFLGKRSKKPFGDLLVAKCIIDALSTQGASRKEVEDQMKVWLKHASDRLKVKSNRA